jgi:phage terminase large subunit-like protein
MPAPTPAQLNAKLATLNARCDTLQAQHRAATEIATADLPTFDADEGLRRIGRAKANDVRDGTSTANAVVATVTAEEAAVTTAKQARNTAEADCRALSRELIETEATRDEVERMLSEAVAVLARADLPALRDQYAAAVAAIVEVIVDMQATMSLTSQYGHHEMTRYVSGFSLPVVDVDLSRVPGLFADLGTGRFSADSALAAVNSRKVELRDAYLA